jgi:hypothetical protein
MTATEHAPARTHAKTRGPAMVRTVVGALAAAAVGLVAGAGFVKVSVLAHWPYMIKYVVISIVGLWSISACADLLVRRRRRAR